MRRTFVTVALAGSLLGGCVMHVAADGTVSIDPTPVIVTPTYSVIPGTGISLVNGRNDLFRYGGYYWRYHNGSWWRSSRWNGGWVINSTVPSAFLRIPMSHPAYRTARYHPSRARPTTTPRTVTTPPRTRPTVPPRGNSGNVNSGRTTPPPRGRPTTPPGQDKDKDKDKNKDNPGRGRRRTR